MGTFPSENHAYSFTRPTSFLLVPDRWTYLPYLVKFVTDCFWESKADLSFIPWLQIHRQLLWTDFSIIPRLAGILKYSCVLILEFRLWLETVHTCVLLNLLFKAEHLFSNPVYRTCRTWQTFKMPGERKNGYFGRHLVPCPVRAKKCSCILQTSCLPITGVLFSSSSW